MKTKTSSNEVKNTCQCNGYKVFARKLNCSCANLSQLFTPFDMKRELAEHSLVTRDNRQEHSLNSNRHSRAVNGERRKTFDKNVTMLLFNESNRSNDERGNVKNGKVTFLIIVTNAASSFCRCNFD